MEVKALGGPRSTFGKGGGWQKSTSASQGVVLDIEDSERTVVKHPGSFCKA